MLDTFPETISKLEKRIKVEYITYSGSAFAICENGDQVFLHPRLVEKMKLNEDDIRSALLIENYEDKIDVTPWRAVRVSATA